MNPKRPHDSRPVPVGDLLPVHDADREPDFAGPDGPARFSKRPGVHADVQTAPDAATGQPATSTMPSPGGDGIEPGKLERARGKLQHDLELVMGGKVVVIDPMWFERLQKLSGRAGVDPSRFVEDLIKKAWVLGPMAHPAPR